MSGQSNRERSRSRSDKITEIDQEEVSIVEQIEKNNKLCKTGM